MIYTDSDRPDEFTVIVNHGELNQHRVAREPSVEAIREAALRTIALCATEAVRAELDASMEDGAVDNISGIRVDEATDGTLTFLRALADRFAPVVAIFALSKPVWDEYDDIRR